MNDTVTSAITARMREPEGLRAMTVVSFVAHVLAAVTIAVAPAGWRTRAVASERDVMTISLGGAPGPRSGGMTPLGGQPVQQVAPPPVEKAPPEPPRAPMAKPPSMVEPTKTPARRGSPTPEAPRTSVEQASGRTPLKGPEVRPGDAVAQTGGAGIGFGLSTGGGGTGGEINLGDFCCPDYLETMLQIIQRNWNSKQQVAGLAAVRFTVQRDGTITDAELAKPSGYAVLDLTAQRAILMSRLPPLPRAYPNNQLTITLSFRYQR